MLLEDQLHARGINLHILSGICGGVHRPNGATIADKMRFMVAAMAAEIERDLIRERTFDGLRAAQAAGRHGGRPTAVTDDVLAVVLARQARGESVTAIAKHLGIGRSTLYRALEHADGQAVLDAVLAELPPDARPLPSVAAYDDLLARPDIELTSTAQTSGHQVRHP